MGSLRKVLNNTHMSMLTVTHPREAQCHSSSHTHTHTHTHAHAKHYKEHPIHCWKCWWKAVFYAFYIWTGRHCKSLCVFPATNNHSPIIRLTIRTSIKQIARGIFANNPNRYSIEPNPFSFHDPFVCVSPSARLLLLIMCALLKNLAKFVHFTFTNQGYGSSLSSSFYDCHPHVLPNIWPRDNRPNAMALVSI